MRTKLPQGNGGPEMVCGGSAGDVMQPREDAAYFGQAIRPVTDGMLARVSAAYDEEVRDDRIRD